MCSSCSGSRTRAARTLGTAQTANTRQRTASVVSAERWLLKHPVTGVEREFAGSLNQMLAVVEKTGEGAKRLTGDAVS